MEVLSFRELIERDYGVNSLLTFHRVLTPRKIWEWKEDPRMKDGAVGFCMVDGKRVVGFVGVLDLPTRTLNGNVEYVGGIYGVYTLPSYARRGIATTLLKRAHQYFASKGYKFSFLNTSRAIIAYNLYRKLGYEDVTDFCDVYKLIQKRTAEKGKYEKKKVDWGRICEIYKRFSMNKTGFVVRDEKYFRWLAKPKPHRSGIWPKNIMVGEDSYVIFRGEKEAICIEELIANNLREAEELIRKLELKGKRVVYSRLVLDKMLLEVYRSLGYDVQTKSYDLLMVKNLSDSSFRQVYGEEFFMTAIDYF